MNFVCNSYHVIDPNFGSNIFITELGESSQKYGQNRQKYGEVMSMIWYLKYETVYLFSLSYK